MLSLNSIGWVSWIHTHIDITSLFVADLWLIFCCHVLPTGLFSMVRRHGWQLPAHTFQVVAITVISLLIVAFYVFFAPFLGSSILECAAMAVYSPVALAVLLLYFRSTAIDPSDPGVLEKENKQRFLCNLDKPHAIPGVLVNVNTNQVTHIKSPLGLLTPARSSSVAHSDKEFDNNASWAEEGRQSMGLFDAKLNRNLGALGFGGVLCGWLVQDDNCRDDGLRHQPPVADEEALFCTLCDVEVRKLSKHCRNCDKCVEGFDHHCRWLNNCVGRKNYVTFVFLMATSLLLLVLNWGTGIAVLARCFMDKRSVDRQILERLGNGFLRTGFTIVVALCTLVSLLASIPLGELFFFHILLMKKGITTYEYVMAMRAQYEPQGLPDGEEQSMPTSPTSSAATGLSGSSSLGLHHRGAWCTPPRVFVEHQDEVIPHLAPGRVPSTVDPDANSPMKDSRFQKSAVKISAWKLAKLDPNEAARAAARARQSSSVLRPLKMHDSSMVDTDYTSTMSSRSSVSTEFGLAGVGSAGTRKGRDTVGYSPQRPAFPFGQAGSKGEMDTRTQSSCSSPSRVSVNECGTSPLSSEGRLTLHVPPRFTALGQPVAQAPSIAGLPVAGFANALSNYRATSLDSINHLRRMNVAPAYEEYVGQSRASQLNRNLRESKRTAVFWSGGAERFKSTIAESNFNSTLEGKIPSLGSTQALAENSPQACFVPENASAVNGSFANNESGGGEGLPGNLLFNGASIFFGGPLCTPASLQRDYSTVSTSAAFADNQVAPPRVRNQDIRLFQGSTLRTQSPVFTPSSLQIETVFLK